MLYHSRFLRWIIPQISKTRRCLGVKRNLIWSLIFKDHELDRGCSLDYVYIRQRFFISLVRRIEQSWRDGNARAVFALSPGVHLGGDSQPIVARRRKGNRRRYSCPAALLSSCRATPCSDVAGNRHFRIARHSRGNILTVFSRGVAQHRSLRSSANSQREIERRVSRRV